MPQDTSCRRWTRPAEWRRLAVLDPTVYLLAHEHPTQRACTSHLEDQAIAIRTEQDSVGYSCDLAPSLRGAIENQDRITLMFIKSPALSKCLRRPISRDIPSSECSPFQVGLNPLPCQP